MTPDQIHQQATVAGRHAKLAYLDANPEPKVRDFACPRCRAQPGHPCRSRFRRKVANSHTSRQDLYIRALGRRLRAADQADDDAYDETCHQLDRTPVDHRSMVHAPEGRAQ